MSSWFRSVAKPPEGGKDGSETISGTGNSVREIAGKGAKSMFQSMRGAVKDMTGRLTGKIEVSVAIERLERDARECRGEARKAKLRAWCAALQEVGVPSHPAVPLTAHASSEKGEGDSSGSLATKEGDPSASGEPTVGEGTGSSSAVEGDMPGLGDAAEWSSLSIGGGLDGLAGDANRHPASSDSKHVQAIRLKQQSFVDSARSDGALVSFRCVFLRSRALELLCASFLTTLPRDTEEEELAREVLGLCLPGGAATASCLLTRLAELSLAMRDHHTVIRVSNQDLADLVHQSLSAVKCDPDREDQVEALERVRSDFHEASARVPKLEDMPTGGVTTLHGGTAGGDKLAEGVTATFDALKQSRLMHDRLIQQLQALQLASEAPALTQLEAKTRELIQAVSSASARLTQSSKETAEQKEKAEDFARARLEGIAADEAEAEAQAQRLESELDALEAQVAATRLALQEKRLKIQTLQEERREFEQANHQVEDELSGGLMAAEIDSGAHQREAFALGMLQSLTDVARSTQRDCLAAELAASSAELAVAEGAVLKSTVQHIWCRNQEAQHLIRRLSFCRSELQQSRDKQAEMTELGMEGMRAQFTTQAEKLSEQYTEGVEDLQAILHIVAHTKKEVEKFLSGVSPETRGSELFTKQESQLEEYLSNIHETQMQFEEMEPPSTFQPGPPVVFPEDCSVASSDPLGVQGEETKVDPIEPSSSQVTIPSTTELSSESAPPPNAGEQPNFNEMKVEGTEVETSSKGELVMDSIVKSSPPDDSGSKKAKVTKKGKKKELKKMVSVEESENKAQLSTPPPPPPRSVLPVELDAEDFFDSVS